MDENKESRVFSDNRNDYGSHISSNISLPHTHLGKEMNG
jgi:hypothetical protein